MAATAPLVVNEFAQYHTSTRSKTGLHLQATMPICLTRAVPFKTLNRALREREAYFASSEVECLHVESDQHPL